MLEVNEIIEKLKDIISSDGKIGKIYDKDVAQALNITQINFATMKLRNKIPFDKILDYCASKKISINWLLYNQDPSSLINTTDKYWIKFYTNIKLSAGGGADTTQNHYNAISIPSHFLNQLGGEKNIKNIEAIAVTGDSMEPTLYNDNIAFIDKTKKEYRKDGLYAISTSDGLLIKRIIKTNNLFKIVSDNSIYENLVISKNEFIIHGKVIGSFGLIY